MEIIAITLGFLIIILAMCAIIFGILCLIIIMYHQYMGMTIFALVRFSRITDIKDRADVKKILQKYER